MGLVEKMKILNLRDKYFKIKSPIIDLYYYLNDRYSIEEEYPPLSEVYDSIKVKFSVHLQDFIAKLLAQKLESKYAYYVSPRLEIDFFFEKRRILGEVKWGKKIEKKLLEIMEEKAQAVKSRKKLLIVKKHPSIKVKDIEIYTPPDLVKIAKSISG